MRLAFAQKTAEGAMSLSSVFFKTCGFIPPHPHGILQTERRNPLQVDFSFPPRRRSALPPGSIR
jgi:hypothetical protein